MTVEATPTPAAPVAGAVDATPAEGAADYAAALALLSAPDVADAPATPAAEPGPVPAAAEPAPAASVPVPANDDTKAILARIARLEHERDTATESAAKQAQELAAYKAKADAHDALRAKGEVSPKDLLLEFGYTPEQAYEIIVQGKEQNPLATAAEKRMAQLEAQLKATQDAIAKQRADADAATAQSAQAAKLEQFKASIPGILTTHAAKDVPVLLSAFKDDPAGLTAAVWDEMQLAFRVYGQDLTLGDAAKRVEAKYARVKGPVGSVAPAPKSVPVPGLTNIPPTQANQPTDPFDMDPDARMAAAIAALG